MAKKIFLFLILMLSCVQVNCSKSTDAITETPHQTYTKNTIVYNTVVGVNPNLLSVDVYHFGTPSATSPVVVYVHGGAWAIGDKANSISNKTSLFASLGYVFVSINYRLSPSIVSTDPNRVMFPTHNNDVADAIKWVYNNIATYGGNKNKIALLGHSAGAHLVSLSGTSNQFLLARGIPLHIIKGVASIDTEGYNVENQCLDGVQYYLNAFGNTNTNWAIASPSNHIFLGTVYPKFFIAKRGSASRIGVSDSFIAQLEGVGVSVTQITANQYDHEGINAAIGATGETAITSPLKTFLAACFL